MSVLAAATGAASGSSASLYLVDTTFGDQRTTVNRLDPATGEMQLAADLGETFSPILGLAAADNKVLYATGTDTSIDDACLGLRSCLLLRVELAPDPSSLPDITIVGPVRSPSGVVTEITGLAFRSDGMLIATSQETGGYYVVDPASAEARLMGISDVEFHGGDTTIDTAGTIWHWTNIGPGAGLYTLDPDTAAASAFQLFPGIAVAGMTAVGHEGTLYAARPSGDVLLAVDPVTGILMAEVPLTRDGVSFDHARGDLDSPFCGDHQACDDGDPGTWDRCTPGGCRYQRADIDVEEMCPCDGPGRPWRNHGEYVSCVAHAARLGTTFGRLDRKLKRRSAEGRLDLVKNRGQIVSEAARSSCGH